MNALMAVHVAAAVFLLGPLAFATGASPRAVRAGAEGVGTLRFLARTTRVYAWASILVLILGLALVQPRWGNHIDDLWIDLSLGLFVLSLALILAVVVPTQRRALRDLEAGVDATRHLGAIAGISGVAALIWLGILFLMFYQPT